MHERQSIIIEIVKQVPPTMTPPGRQGEASGALRRRERGNKARGRQQTVSVPEEVDEPASNDSAVLPGCSAKLGIIWDREETKGDQRAGQIKAFKPETRAVAAGLQVGDSVVSIDGEAPLGRHHFRAGELAFVVFERAGTQAQVSVPLVDICLGD